MKKAVITGSRGFIGKNLLNALSQKSRVRATCFNFDDDIASLRSLIRDADIIYHLAGVNRPENVQEFRKGNTEFTRTLVSLLMEQDKKPVIVMPSSIQSELNNPYGISKKEAEDIIFDYGGNTGAPVYVFRLANVFGKWSQPNYNSVVATFCYNISRGLNIVVHDRNTKLDLVYIDDVVAAFLGVLGSEQHANACTKTKTYLSIQPTYNITLGDLAQKIGQLRDVRKTLVIPDISDTFMKYLFATYLSYLDKRDFSYGLEVKSDARGSLAELIKSENFGQIFLSKTRAGVMRGNHYHDTKIEKFCVIQGVAIIKFRHLITNDIFSYSVSGDELRMVDIPPGYTHSIENVSDGEMIVLFWASQIFDANRPDTYYCEVESAKN